MMEPIKVDGLAQFSRDLRKLDKDLPKMLRIAHNEAAEIVVNYARPKVPRKSGRAAGTLKAMSTRTEGRVRGGSARAPYYPWLDFGGRVGKNRSVRRQWYPGGRYIFAALDAHRNEITEVMTKAMLQVAKSAGVEVND